ncbi:MAG: hypothetical protein IPM29_24275 [Planctomycetes bacterium]|nr:hypothetical protein [Planctomycetota bacterium]
MNPTARTAHLGATSWIPALCLCAGLVAGATAQDDLRDTLRLTDGTELHGRVETPFATEELTIAQGGRHVRVPVAKIASRDTVADRIAEFCQRQTGCGRNARMHWMLAEWAESVELRALARVEARYVLLLDPDHEAAHEFLGHRKHPKRGWLIQDDDRSWRTAEQLDERHAKFGRAFELDSERFRVRTDAGQEVAVVTLLDLERLAAWLFAEFGAPLQLSESLTPMVVHVHADAGDFPSWSSAPLPYYVPPPFGDHGATWVEGAGPRPHRLFEVGAQLVLYRCLARGAFRSDAMDRPCPAAELGFARWVESCWRGDPGLAAAGAPQPDPAELLLARAARSYGLENLVHLSVREHFYGALLGSRRIGDTTVHWASVHAFVQFLLDPRRTPNQRAEFLAWLRAALADGKGDSSSAVDEAFGQPIERLEEPFDRWLAAQGAAPPQRRR